MTQGLDDRIKKEVIRVVSDSHPKLISQELIYQHLENNIEFTDKQKELHHQIRGQIEPNWQHDARNIIHSLKRAGKLISPIAECYCLPVFPPLESDSHITHWNIMVKTVSESPHLIGLYAYEEVDGGIEVSRIEGGKTYLIRPELVRERVDHLVQCGGQIEVSSFHKWNTLAYGIILLHPELSLQQNEDLVRVTASNSILTVPRDFPQWVHKGGDKLENTPENTRRTVARQVEEEHAESVSLSNSNRTENSTRVKYEWAVLNANATMDDEDQVIHRADCPPKKNGGPQVWCPICGVKMKATSQGKTAFFTHDSMSWPYGTSQREYMELPPNSPTWKSDPPDYKNDVTAPYPNGWQWDKIHRVLGDPVAKPSRSTTESLRKIPVPVTFQKTDGSWTVWAISPTEQDSNRFRVIDSPQAFDYNGNTWYQINSLEETSIIETSDGSREKIRWPTTKRIVIGDTEGTFNHPRFYSPSVTGSGHFYTMTGEDDEPDEIIGGIGFTRSFQIEIPRLVPALPSINGSIPYLTDSDIVPIAVINKGSNLTRIESGDELEPWYLFGEIHLNAAAFRDDEQPMNINPSIVLHQYSKKGGNKSQINLYPARGLPIPGSVKVMIDNQQFPAQVTSMVSEIPERVSLVDSMGNKLEVSQNDASARYVNPDAEWFYVNGRLEHVLETLRHCQASAFAIKIKPNSNPYNLIMISKALQPETIDSDSITKELENALQRSAKLKGQQEEAEEMLATLSDIEEEIKQYPKLNLESEPKVTRTSNSISSKEKMSHLPRNLRVKMAKREKMRKGACECGGLPKVKHLIGNECFRPGSESCRRRARRRKSDD